MRLPLRQTIVSAMFLVATQVVFAQAPKTVFLEDLTWTELRDQIQAGKSTIIIPIGGTEQSGPDVALGKHNLRVKLLSQKIAEGLGNAIVAPVIAYVPEGNTAPLTSHMRFPGTVTVPDDVFEKTLESAANSFQVHGFRNIIFLGDHGGYQNNIKRVVARLNKLWPGAKARVFVPPNITAPVPTVTPRSCASTATAMTRSAPMPGSRTPHCCSRWRRRWCARIGCETLRNSAC